MQFDTMNIIRHMKILVTGSAGFIGSNLVLRLLESKEPKGIVGLDNLNNYYDPSLKEYRLSVILSASEESRMGCCREGILRLADARSG